MRTDAVQTYIDGEDVGYLGNNQRWWFDETFEHSFTIFDLDTFYPDTYFENDHVGRETVINYVKYVLDYGRSVLGREVHSILEIGCAGGWFTNEFIKLGIDIIAIEGTVSGVNRAVNRGIPLEVIIKHDLRLPLNLHRKFDIVLCTEVAEHIECPFSSQLICNLVNHSDLIWFSFEEPGGNDAAYHHCNEQPIKFWQNLFRFYGYKMIRLPENVTTAVETRGKYICVAESLLASKNLFRDESVMNPILTGLGTGEKSNRFDHGYGFKYLVKKLTPPILIDLANALFAKMKR